MRDRLIAGFVGVTVLTITLFAVIRAYSVADLLESEERQQIDRSVTLIAGLLGERVRDGDEITKALLQRQLGDGEQVEFDPADGEVVEASSVGYVDGGGGSQLRGTRPVAGGGAVTLSRSTAQVEERVAGAVLRIVLVGVILGALAAVLGFVAARWISAPFRDLARLAGEFGRGRFDVEIPHYSIPEAEEIGSAMREAERELTGLIGREREFASKASHQLKTPVTALRLNLEDLTLWPQTHPDVAAELTRGVTELDRLSANVNDLLDLTRGQRLGATAEIDLCAVIIDTARRWKPRVEADGRRLVDLVPGQVAVRLPPGPVAQILDALIGNAVRHGSGDISVTVAALDTHVRVQVSDQGGRSISDDIFRRDADEGGRRGDDIGLLDATRIAEGLGGYLRVEPEPPTTFTLMVPRSRPLG